jgi:hypothetical protein
MLAIGGDRESPGGRRELEAAMRKCGNISMAGLVALAACFAACQQAHSLLEHKLVVTGNQHSIPLFSDEQSFLKISRMKQQGGVEGMAGDVSKNLQTKAIDDQTPVTIVSRDDNGAVVEITGGPMKGQSGFVAIQNLD